MIDLPHHFNDTFHQGRFSSHLLRGPLTLATLEAADAGTGAPLAGAQPALPPEAHEFWFASDFVHHLLSMATDPTIDNSVEIGIIDTRIALSHPEPLLELPRTVRIRTAVVPGRLAIPAAVGQVAEKPCWAPRGEPAAAGQPALQHVVRRSDIERCVLARSLHWIELYPGRPGARRS